MKRDSNPELSMDQLVKEIDQKLNDILDSLAWSVSAGLRFKVGQRVEFSRTADRKGLSARRKKGVRRGTLIAIEDTFWIKVKLDGYAQPSSFHHSFFNPVTGIKLF
jgi:hypothetical protein